MFCGSQTVYLRLGLILLVVLNTSAQSIGLKQLLTPELLVSSPQQPGTITQDTAAAPKLHIVVLEGEAAVNIVKTKTAVQPVVEVRDKNKLPVAGAWVTFSTPDHGASAVFANGSHSFMIMTNSEGRVAVLGMKPVGTGSFNLSVSASFRGEVATASISQTNRAKTSTSSDQNGGIIAPTVATHTRVLLFVVAGAAIVAAVTAGIVVSRGGPSATISQTGTSTIGVPHSRVRLGRQQ